MKKMSLALVGVALVFFSATTACRNPEPKAPDTGKVTMVVPGSAACLDKGQYTTGVLYVPFGTDPNGAPWPSKVACVSPTGKMYAVGSVYP